ncbi:G-protein coupled receptor dmsr-1-like [Watersipora subatra]|uniref:G-protein coupled receptor dmsr-1-like n=1 Tax=Watersipora subatra TaxID=2589382 RepID=UPI00355AD465
MTYNHGLVAATTNVLSSISNASAYNSTSSAIYPNATSLADLNGLRTAMAKYEHIHGPLSLTLCIIGVAVNILYILVLSHKDMLSPVNRLLQAIAIADLVTMLTYIPYSLLFYIVNGVKDNAVRNSYPAISFLKFHGLSSMISHTASIWLTVSVGVFRYMFLLTKLGQRLCSLKGVHITISVVVVLSVLVNSPQLLILRINKWIDANTGESWYFLDTDGMPKHNKSIAMTQYVMTALLTKIGPCLLLIIVSALLIRFLMKTQNRYHNIRQGSIGNGSILDRRRQDQTNQTTKLLIAVAIVFTLSELPQGICFGLSSFGLDNSLEKMYWLLGNLFDLLTMISCSVNFLLYCSMSSQFREVFVKILKLENIRPPSLRIFSCKQSKALRESSTGMSLQESADKNLSTESINLEVVVLPLVPSDVA